MSHPRFRDVTDEGEYQCIAELMIQYSLMLKIDTSIGGKVLVAKAFSEVGYYEGCEKVTDYDRDKIRKHFENDANLINPDDARNVGHLKDGVLTLFFEFSRFAEKLCGGTCDNTGGVLYYETLIDIEMGDVTIDQLRQKLSEPCGYGTLIGPCELNQCIANYARFDSQDWGPTRVEQINECYRQAMRDFYKATDALDCGVADTFCERPVEADPSNFDTFNYRTQQERDLSTLGYHNIAIAHTNPFTHKKLEEENFALTL
jgi:hypothetical protein